MELTMYNKNLNHQSEMQLEKRHSDTAIFVHYKTLKESN